ncbi:MAG: transporter substrate-binding domain-containing protein [Clostridia bacterium]|nr:transporter substrate-binding domain-containing protein [Clostridia bacterium]
MKKFVKFMSLLVAGTMLLGAVGCGSSSTDNGGSEETTAEASGAEGSGTASVKTVQEGKLIWATNAEFAPYEYMEGSEVVGIDAEIADAIAAKLGLEAQVENMDFDAIISSVTSGKADIGLAGMTVDPDRLNNVNFSDTYVEAGQAIVVTTDSDIKSAADLSGKIIGVQRGTTGDEYVSKAENGVNPASVERYGSGTDAAQSLITGKIDAIVIDNEPAKKIAEASPDKLVKLDETLTSEEYAIAVDKNNTELLDAINTALQEMKDSGELQAILDKYLNEE